MEAAYNGPERREFFRLDYATPLTYKVCKEETISKLLQGYTADISELGVLCNIKDRVNKDDILWLCFDRATLNICAEIEKKALIYQQGVIGKVVRIEPKDIDVFDVGVRFITREERNLTNIRPEADFTADAQK